ncbi:MAG: phosphoribosyl-AMP cyclohydrolase [Candidatus Poribacteria bacterium]|nr:MAG: phosphoribosyl-AMP cyclohydrolase [Candidatus Poribacteria bacterium]
MEILEAIRFNEQGLVPAIVQDAENGQVLMMAWMNAEAVRRTLETGRATFWSRSRQQFWVKGETSGHTQEVKAVHLDCDGDTLLVQVVQKGAACHEGYRSCFFRTVQPDGSLSTNQERLVDPAQVYGRK